jgi:hypothetical protein
MGQFIVIKPEDHVGAAQTYRCQEYHYQPLKVIHVIGCIIDTLEALIVNNATITNVKKSHYVIASLKKEAKDLVSNLQITNENFAVAWQLVTQRYNNKRHSYDAYKK